MARAIWKGSISFGLVHIPVGLFSAEKPDEMSFRQIDKRNHSPVGYKKYNKKTGEEVEMDQIVKGYEYEDERYVLLSDEDMKRANPEKTQTVEITDFVDLDDIEPTFYEKPYYLAPTTKNVKGYALLREAMRRTNKVGIARVVIRTREQLAAVIPIGNVLVLEILRYPHEIRATDELDVPAEDLSKVGVSQKEVDMAEMLIQGMTSEWEPDKYHDSYRDDLMALIHKRIESGNTEEIDETPVEEAEERTDVIDIMSLLKRSVAATAKGGRAAADTGAGEDEAAEEKEAPKKKAPRPAAKAAATKKPKSTASRAGKPKPKTRKSA